MIQLIMSFFLILQGELKRILTKQNLNCENWREIWFEFDKRR